MQLFYYRPYLYLYRCNKCQMKPEKTTIHSLVRKLKKITARGLYHQYWLLYPSKLNTVDTENKSHRESSKQLLRRTAGAWRKLLLGLRVLVKEEHYDCFERIYIYNIQNVSFFCQSCMLLLTFPVTKPLLFMCFLH